MSGNASGETNRAVTGRIAPLFVWGVWGLTFLAALGYVVAFGRNVPCQDDWIYVPVLIEKEADLLGWLWCLLNEHRLPLPKLVILTWLQLTGGDFRAAMFLNVVALGSLAFAMVQVVSRLRGRVDFADAFFPLALLHWGHGENLIWSVQLGFILPTCLAGTLLLILVRGGARLTPWSSLAAGFCLLLLPLCGAQGLALVPALTLGMICAGVMALQRPNGNRRAGLMALLAALTALAFVGAYFHNYHPTVWYVPADTGLKDRLRTTFQFLTLGFGRSLALQFWQWDYSWVATATALLLTGAALARGWFKAPQRRFLVGGLVVFLGAMLSLALGLGWGRAGAGYFGGFELRYVTLATPLLCAVYYCWAVPGVADSRVSRVLLFGLMSLAYVVSVPEGLAVGRERRKHAEGFARDLREGTPPYLLISRYVPQLSPSQGWLAACLRELHEAGYGPFVNLGPDPPFEEVALPVKPVTVYAMTWDGTAGRCNGRESYLEFRLPAPRFIAGLRLTFSHANQQGSPPTLKARWKKVDQTDYTEWPQYQEANLATRSDATIPMWVGATIQEFRIYPDHLPCEFGISELTLLLPPRGGSAAPDR